jgi:VIT family
MDPSSSSTADNLLVTRALKAVSTLQKRPLDAVDRFSEVIFGLVMVLTFTSALSVAESGRGGVREMLVAALTCNVAWGLVDGVMFVLTSIIGRGRAALVMRGIRAADPARARAIVLAALPEGVASITDEAEADRMVVRVRALPEPRPRLITGMDLRGGLGSCLLVVLATFPPTIPFLLIEDPTRALRVSNAVAVVCLFLAGYYLGKATGLRAWLLGLAMVVLGTALVVLTIALGG